jgi:hypothetical protein
VEPVRSHARIFLDAHPDLDAVRAQSPVWPELRAAAELRVGAATMYVVGGDTLGDEDQLFVDALARGARPSADRLSRALFLALSDRQQTVVRRELLQQSGSSGDDSSAAG